MSDVDDVIEAAAKVLCEDDGTPWGDAEWWQRGMHRATAVVLHRAGLLATCFEYRVRDNKEWIFGDQGTAYKYAEGGTVERRGVSEWRADQ